MPGIIATSLRALCSNQFKSNLTSTYDNLSSIIVLKLKSRRQKCRDALLHNLLHTFVFVCQFQCGKGVIFYLKKSANSGHYGLSNTQKAVNGMHSDHVINPEGNFLSGSQTCEMF